eukprot:NODE_18435_length_893_cov_4.612272.p4 GENE.NODE_18435_length_893_cov_4.612272~~NODE_18435_length_893_cov_4.612272.p4  ORF type:complete len:59 (-),score=0.96 NODE_18435_length_893_cov_4.612272:249-425(-)
MEFDKSRGTQRLRPMLYHSVCDSTLPGYKVDVDKKALTRDEATWGPSTGHTIHTTGPA